MFLLTHKKKQRKTYNAHKFGRNYASCGKWKPTKFKSKQEMEIGSKNVNGKCLRLCRALILNQIGNWSTIRGKNSDSLHFNRIYFISIAVISSYFHFLFFAWVRKKRNASGKRWKMCTLNRALALGFGSRYRMSKSQHTYKWENFRFGKLESKEWFKTAQMCKADWIALAGLGQ